MAFACCPTGPLTRGLGGWSAVPPRGSWPRAWFVDGSGLPHAVGRSGVGVITRGGFFLHRRLGPEGPGGTGFDLSHAAGGLRCYTRGSIGPVKGYRAKVGESASNFPEWSAHGYRAISAHRLCSTWCINQGLSSTSDHKKGN